MKINGVIFDENGISYLVDNMDVFAGNMKDELLAKSYIRTIFHHESILRIEELVKEGKAKIEVDDETYDPQLAMNAIESMRDEIVERFGEEYHDYLINKIGL